MEKSFPNISIKRIIAIVVGIAILAFFVFCNLTACNKNKNEQTIAFEKSDDMEAVSYRRMDGINPAFIMDTHTDEGTVMEMNVSLIDTSFPDEELASSYMNDILTNADSIYLEWSDNNGANKNEDHTFDAWVWVDETLLQEDLISNGICTTKDYTSDYKYADELLSCQNKAKEEKLGIWSE